MKIAILGTWHVHAPHYVSVAQKLGQVVGVYEDDPEWKAEFAEKFGITAYESVDELLGSECEGVIVCASTDRHAELIIKAANAGKHIFTEKVLALTVEECLAVKEAVERNGVKFVISYPWKTVPTFMAVKKAVDNGLIGKVNYLRFRNCHSGSISHWLPAHFYNKKQCGGGAMIDLGAHGMYLTHWFLGEPSTYSSAFTHFCRDEKDAILNPSGIEDNAVTVMTFDSGAIAVNETGFVSTGCPETFEVGGDKGYITCTTERVNAVVDGIENVKIDIPEPVSSPLECFLSGTDIDGCGIDEAIALTKMMVGAYKNA